MLERRRACPACECELGATLHDVSYADPQVLKFLHTYYFHPELETIERYVRGGRLTLIKCGGCGLVYQREIPDPDFMLELYENWILEGDHLSPMANPMPIEHYTYLASEVMHLLAEQRAIVGSDRRLQVLDFGMGWSAWLKMARALGAEVWGAELSRSKVIYAESIGIPVLTLKEIAAHRFDLIGAEQVLEHVPKPAPLLRLLVGALEPTGYIKISVPPGGSVQRVLSGWRWEHAVERVEDLMPVQPLEHINCFSRRSLDTLARRHGLVRAPISALRAMAFSTGWHSPVPFLKNILRPIYRFSLRQGTYAVYKLREPGAAA